MKLLSIRLPEELDSELELAAQKAGISKSELARSAIDIFLRSEEKSRIRNLLRSAGAFSSERDIEIAEEALDYDIEAQEIEESEKADPWPRKWWR